MALPPDGLAIYRVVTGQDDAAFCHRVSAGLETGYQVTVAHAVVWNGAAHSSCVILVGHRGVSIATKVCSHKDRMNPWIAFTNGSYEHIDHVHKRIVWAHRPCSKTDRIDT